MDFTLRIDLDYVPWDSPDAKEFGHGEPAMVLKLLDLARARGYKYQFFASNRSIRAFPSNSEAVLNDGHDLDWFCKHPDDPEERFLASRTLFESVGHTAIGMAVRAGYPPDGPRFEGIEQFRFLSAHPGFCPEGLTLFPVETRALREGLRAGFSARSWCDQIKAQLRDFASRNRSITVAVRPQVLAKHDPKLVCLREIVDLAGAIGFDLTTYRDLVLAGDDS